MELSQNNILSNNSGFGLQTGFNNKLSVNSNFGIKTDNKGAYYAKKGEPMYMKEMDSDEDGIVTFEEFKDYCQANGISPKEMVRMASLASSYRTMQAQERASKEIERKNGNDTQINAEVVNSEGVYARRGDGKYDEAMDVNNDDKVSYKEYMEYCKDHAQTREQKSDTKVSESENGEFKTINTGKALSTYTQNETEAAAGMIDNIG